jgi:hypothetical protein
LFEELLLVFQNKFLSELEATNTSMNGHTNGHTNGAKLVNGASSSYDDGQAVNEIRKFVIDICRQNGGGHGGSGKNVFKYMCYEVASELKTWDRFEPLDFLASQLSLQA